MKKPTKPKVEDLAGKLKRARDRMPVHDLPTSTREEILCKRIERLLDITKSVPDEYVLHPTLDAFREIPPGDKTYGPRVKLVLARRDAFDAAEAYRKDDLNLADRIILGAEHLLLDFLISKSRNKEVADLSRPPRKAERTGPTSQVWSRRLYLKSMEIRERDGCSNGEADVRACEEDRELGLALKDCTPDALRLRRKTGKKMVEREKK